jgi:AcrR family transcriptional regulator
MSEPAQSLMQRRKQAAADEIASIAIDLFSRDGFLETTVDAIAETAGCSRRTFYRYFGSKEDVLFFDLEDVLEQLAAVLDRCLAQGLDAWAAVSESLIASHFADERPVQRMAIWLAEPALHSRYMQHVASAERIIVERLTRHQGTTPGDDELAQIIAVLAVGAYRACVATHPAGSSDTLTRHLQTLLTKLARGFGTENLEVAPARRRPARPRLPSRHTLRDHE